MVQLIWHGDPLHAKTYKKRSKKILEAKGIEPTRRAVERVINDQGDRALHDSFLRVFRSISEEPESTHRRRHRDEPEKTWDDDQRVFRHMLEMSETVSDEPSRNWLAFEGFRNAVRRDRPDISLSIFLDFIYEQAEREFDDVELLVWMLASYLEFRCVDIMLPLGIHKDSFIGRVVPPDIWIPEADDEGRLCTSRYKAVSYTHLTLPTNREV